MPSHTDSAGWAANEVDASFRPVALLLVTKAVLWLVAGSLLTLLASIKLHGPSMMSGSAWLTYGRVLPAGWTALVFGFAGQAGTLLGLWTLARAAGQRLQAPGLVLAGGVLWNLGVLAGVVGILAGFSTGREGLEMPSGALALLTVGAALTGVAGWKTYSARTTARVFPSAWFVLLGLIAFVWFASAALAMLGGADVRGSIQLLIQRWAGNGLQRIWLGGLALGLILFALPRAAQKPLASRELTLISFWSLVFFTPWAVTLPGDPLPRWVVSFGVAGHTLAAIGVLAAAINFWKTGEGAVARLFSTSAGRLVTGAAVAYVVAGTLQYLVSLRVVASVVRFTWLPVGIDWALVGGGAIWVVLSVLPEFVERATGRRLNPGLLNLNATLSLVGVGVVVLSLILAGVIQGMSLSNPGKAYMDTVKGSMHGVRLSSLGFLLFFLGQLPLLAAVVGGLTAVARDAVGAVKSWGLAPTGKGMGARS
ncbi:MAG: cbb3-type cytochrome c oxidase subunit I [Verrucomicrobiales bacterium]|nr:cbb3-type cytochrome c oxidase subunit I [Verrucomicrobiales bacterium]